jgi:YHS domain-containing protein
MAQHKDPTCGMTVEDTSAALTSDYRGTCYCFCSQDCTPTFDGHPGDSVESRNSHTRSAGGA